MTRCYNCGADQPAAVCFKESCQNEINLNGQLFCFAHQQSWQQQVDKLEEQLTSVMLKLEE